MSEANRILIEAIEDSLQIADQGRSARKQAQGALAKLEQQMRKSLAMTAAHERGHAGAYERTGRTT